MHGNAAWSEMTGIRPSIAARKQPRVAHTSVEASIAATSGSARPLPRSGCSKDLSPGCPRLAVRAARCRPGGIWSWLARERHSRHHGVPTRRRTRRPKSPRSRHREKRVTRNGMGGGPLYAR